MPEKLKKINFCLRIRLNEIGPYSQRSKNYHGKTGEIRF
jgi:hypothetical protein